MYFVLNIETTLVLSISPKTLKLLPMIEIIVFAPPPSFFNTTALLPIWG